MTLSASTTSKAPSPPLDLPPRNSNNFFRVNSFTALTLSIIAIASCALYYLANRSTPNNLRKKPPTPTPTPTPTETQTQQTPAPAQAQVSPTPSTPPNPNPQLIAVLAGWGICGDEACEMLTRSTVGDTVVNQAKEAANQKLAQELAPTSHLSLETPAGHVITSKRFPHTCTIEDLKKKLAQDRKSQYFRCNTSQLIISKKVGDPDGEGTMEIMSDSALVSSFAKEETTRLIIQIALGFSPEQLQSHRGNPQIPLYTIKRADGWAYEIRLKSSDADIDKDISRVTCTISRSHGDKRESFEQSIYLKYQTDTNTYLPVKPVFEYAIQVPEENAGKFLQKHNCLLQQSCSLEGIQIPGTIDGKNIRVYWPGISAKPETTRSDLFSRIVNKDCLMLCTSSDPNRAPWSMNIYFSNHPLINSAIQNGTFGPDWKITFVPEDFLGPIQP